MGEVPLYNFPPVPPHHLTYHTRLLQGVARFETVPCTLLTFGVPETLREVNLWQHLSGLWRGSAGSNRLFQGFDLYWHPPESGDLWYISGD